MGLVCATQGHGHFVRFIGASFSELDAVVALSDVFKGEQKASLICFTAVFTCRLRRDMNDI